ncbi:hypothetical protein [Burkholderia sp. WAC0059]|uniref:hypothetical protein n=1 Tax=Burkholderia sp. WAC0059 TaxID=2066022 RepID=UPI0021558A6F|nr:hypothetical protein [Burkholderia sp. WAC0059]
MSLENHLAFAALNAGAGDHVQISRLLRMVYLAWYLRDASPAVETELFRQGERALQSCIERSVASREWVLEVNEQDIVGQILSLHDGQLAVVPAHRYLRAWEQLKVFLKSDRASVVDS